MYCSASIEAARPSNVQLQCQDYEYCWETYKKRFNDLLYMGVFFLPFKTSNLIRVDLIFEKRLLYKIEYKFSGKVF